MGGGVVREVGGGVCGDDGRKLLSEIDAFLISPFLLLLGDCTPLMEAASGGYADIVSLLLDHGAEVNAKSAAGEE